MGWRRSSSSSTSGADNAGGTDWDAKADKAGSKASDKNDRPYHGHDGNTPGNGGSISESEMGL